MRSSTATATRPSSCSSARTPAIAPWFAAPSTPPRDQSPPPNPRVAVVQVLPSDQVVSELARREAQQAAEGRRAAAGEGARASPQAGSPTEGRAAGGGSTPAQAEAQPSLVETAGLAEPTSGSAEGQRRRGGTGGSRRASFWRAAGVSHALGHEQTLLPPGG